MSGVKAIPPTQGNQVALKLFNVYKSNRSLFLNTSYLILITAAFSKATTSSNKHKDGKDVTLANPKKSTSYRLTKESFKRLMKAAIPSATNETVIYLVSHIALLVARALLTIKVASLDGRLVGALVSKRLKVFSQLLAYWMLLGIPASIVNSLLTWTKKKLSRAIRINLDTGIVNDYLPDNLNANYYSLIQLSGNRIKDPNQRITTDISRLSDALSNLPGQLLKPTLDLLLCAQELSKSGVGNGEGTLLLGLLAHFSTMILKLFSPPFAKLASEKANLEGQLRSSHSKIVGNSEEIAFLRGHNRELDHIDYNYYSLEKFLKREYWKRAVHEIVQTFIVKYMWGAAGLTLCSAPIFINKFLGQPPDPNHAGDFITNRRLLLTASDSLDRLIYSRRFLLSVIGHASRVSEIQDVLQDIKDKGVDTNNITYANEITFNHVKLLTPADVVLIEDLDFSIKQGDHLLIAGPNGCGKSSLFRMLGGLWPVKYGNITIPTTENMFYLPQRAYLTEGTLREQIIYPHSIEHYNSKSHVTDTQLVEILQLLQLDEFAPELDVVKNWDEELSTGAQQRLAMARLYYHKPKFAVLDECTSAVAPEMEQLMYKHAQQLGITVLSVAHRSALWHFHNYILKFDGKGKYVFSKLDAEKRLKFEKERLILEKNLRDVPIITERLSELKRVSNAQHRKLQK